MTAIDTSKADETSASSLSAASQASAEDQPAEVLFREARRRERRRRLVVLLVVVVVAAGIAAVTSAMRHSPLRKPVPTPATSASSSLARASGGAAPVLPESLAIGPAGSLFIVDTVRDQILQRLSDGRYRVAAGSGRRGFSGDGGLATRAELSLSYDSGLVLGPNGTLYLSDSGNDRVRAVAPNGSIETVVGGGTTPVAQSQVPARRAAISPHGLTIGPDGNLYIASSQGVYQLERNGTLSWVVGKNAPLPSPWGGVYSNPAIQLDFTNADRLAFDDEGDLFVAGGGGYGLYERTAAGALRYVANDRAPGGFFGSLTTAPDGRVIFADGGLVSLGSNGSRSPVRASLSKLLGKLPPHQFFGIDYYVFDVGYGVAVAHDGDIYVDSVTGDTLPTFAAIARITPDGRATLVWKGNRSP